jgi:[ribosomal protein S18]-alanine N-acetyltransferase
MGNALERTGPGLTIRRAALDDLAQVTRIDERCFPHGAHYNYLIFRQLYDAAGDYFLVAATDEIIGFIIALPDTQKQNAAWILVVGVSPDQRHQGAATDLGEELSKILKRDGRSTLYFTTMPTNSVMLSFAKRFGFKIEGREADYFGPGEERLLLVKS